MVEKPLNQSFSKNVVLTNRKNYSSEPQKLQPSNNNLKRTKDFKDSKESDKADKLDTDLISNAFSSKEKNKETETLVIESYIEEKSLNFLYGSNLIKRMATFSFSDFETFKTFINKLEYAHKSVEKECNITIPVYEGSHYFEFTQDCLLKTFNRAIQQQRFGKVNNIASYLFISFKQVFTDLANGMLEKENKV